MDSVRVEIFFEDPDGNVLEETKIAELARYLRYCRSKSCAKCLKNDKKCPYYNDAERLAKKYHFFKKPKKEKANKRG